MVKNNSGTALNINSQPKPEFKDADRRTLLGKNISIALAIKGLKGKELAKLLDVRPSTITNWKKGDRIPDIFQLKDIADITGQTTDWFYEEHK